MADSMTLRDCTPSWGALEDQIVFFHLPSWSSVKDVRREEVCTACTTPLQKPFVYLCIPASRYVDYTSGILSSPTESAFLVPRMSAWRRAAIKRPLTRMPDEDLPAD